MSSPWPQIWPVTNMAKVLWLAWRGDTSGPVWQLPTPLPVVLHQLRQHAEWMSRIALAYVTYMYTFPSLDPEVPIDYGYWACVLLARDYLILIPTITLWHWLLIAGPTAKYVHGYKFEPEYQKPDQMRRDIVRTSLGFSVLSLYELIMIYWWREVAPGYRYLDFWQYPVWSLFWLEAGFLLNDAFTYWHHRVQHPWRFRYGWDGGKFLYKHLHSIHHRSRNTGPWTTISGHPIETLTFFLVMFLPMAVMQHPMHLMVMKWHSVLSPMQAHDGFKDPGGNSLFHFLHHHKGNVNYGTPTMFANMDGLFGSHDKGEEYIRERMAEQAQKNGKAQ